MLVHLDYNQQFKKFYFLSNTVIPLEWMAPTCVLCFAFISLMSIFWQLHDYPSHANSKNAVVVNYLVGG